MLRVLLFLIYFSCVSAASKIITCYYTFPGPLPPEKVDANLCTHLLVFNNTSPNKDGSINSYNQEQIQRIQAIRKRNKDLKILVSLTAFDKTMGEMVANDATLENFVQNAVNLVLENNFDGLDLDWEFPVLKTFRFSERKLYTVLIKKLREAFDQKKPNLLLTAAVPAPYIAAEITYEIDQLNIYLDFINLMCYDNHVYLPFFPFTGYNTNLFKLEHDLWPFSRFNAEDATNFYTEKGMNRSKILVGLATYARGYELALESWNTPYAYATSASKYASGNGPQQAILNNTLICRLLKGGYTRVWDDVAKSVYCYGDKQWISYSDSQSLETAANWIKNNNFGGAMVFDFTWDDIGDTCDGAPFPLIRKIHDTLLQ